MRRRELIKLVGGAAVVAPLPGFAQQGELVRPIAIVMPYDEGDSEGQLRLEALRDGLRQLGWSDGRSLRIEVRWLGTDPAFFPPDYATQVVQLKPDVILATSTGVIAALARGSKAFRSSSPLQLTLSAVALPLA